MKKQKKKKKKKEEANTKLHCRLKRAVGSGYVLHYESIITPRLYIGRWDIFRCRRSVRKNCGAFTQCSVVVTHTLGIYERNACVNSDDCIFNIDVIVIGEPYGVWKYTRTIITVESIGIIPPDVCGLRDKNKFANVFFVFAIEDKQPASYRTYTDGIAKNNILLGQSKRYYRIRVN